MTMGIEAKPAPIQPAAQRPSKLGEELPVFCEKCGYSLHGLPQVRCEQCGVLQFHCPECNHHQPINTLRPVFQRALGRMRAAWLIFWVFFKLNYFGWLLFAWAAMGAEGFVNYGYYNSVVGRRFSSQELTTEVALGTAMFAIPFAIFGRMFLLRWRLSLSVALVLAGLVVLAILMGVVFQTTAWGGMARQDWTVDVWNRDLAACCCWVAGMVIVGSVSSWPIWVGLVRAFLPTKVGTSLLEWQRSLSNPPAAALGRE
jgi:hypothetical protein